MTNKYMQAALHEAVKYKNEVPVGAVIVRDNHIIAVGSNQMITENNAILHAEINAINQAVQVLREPYLLNCDLYVTKEPCLMCFGAIMHARIRRVYFGAYDVKYGAFDYILSIMDKKKTNHVPEIYDGIMEQECRNVLEDFFR